MLHHQQGQLSKHIMHSAARKVFLSGENKREKNPVEKMEMYDVFWNN